MVLRPPVEPGPAFVAEATPAADMHVYRRST